MEQQRNNFFSKIRQTIQKGGEISPFLCVGKPLAQIQQNLREGIETLCDDFWVDKNYIFTLKDAWESLKIGEMKEFITHSYQKSSFDFQVFIIENYARATIEASNAALKFFEEPWIGNIIFLTSESEAGILDTILSRVTIERMWDTNSQYEIDTLWRDRVLRYIENRDQELASIIYQDKIEQAEATGFLLSLLSLHSEWRITLQDIADFEQDMQGLQKNNLLPRYIVDKYFLQL